jgi:hypothetical protein
MPAFLSTMSEAIGPQSPVCATVRTLGSLLWNGSDPQVAYAVLDYSGMNPSIDSAAMGVTTIKFSSFSTDVSL